MNNSKRKMYTLTNIKQVISKQEKWRSKWNLWSNSMEKKLWLQSSMWRHFWPFFLQFCLFLPKCDYNHQCGNIFYHFSSSILSLLILNVTTIIVWRVGLMDLLWESMSIAIARCQQKISNEVLVNFNLIINLIIIVIIIITIIVLIAWIY